MYTRLPRLGTDPRTAALLRRLGAFLAAACGLLALTAGSPAMPAAVSVPHSGPSPSRPPRSGPDSAS